MYVNNAQWKEIQQIQLVKIIKMVIFKYKITKLICFHKCYTVQKLFDFVHPVQMNTYEYLYIF
jgi:hypothetical protein